jgi:hypothetical protein
MTVPITITIAREHLDDGSIGHTVQLGSLSVLADSEEDARELANVLFLGIAAHTGEEVRIRSTVEARN